MILKECRMSSVEIHRNVYSDKMFALKRLSRIVSRHVENFFRYTTIERKDQTI